MLLTLTRIATYLAFLICTLSFLGAIHPAFDSLAVIRPLTWLAAALGSFTLLRPFKEILRGFLVLMAFSFLAFVDTSIDIERPGFRLLQHNLLFTNNAPDLQMLADTRKPDVFTLQEIDQGMSHVTGLQGYPYQQICHFATVGDVGVVSRHPMIAQGCANGEMRGFAWARIKNEAGDEVTVVSVHLYWPWPHQQRAQLNAILPQIAALPKPVILGGDLNQVLWSYTADAIAKATGSAAIEGLRFTLVRPPLWLPIDQIFGNGPHEITVLNRYGSDHNAVMADFLDWQQFATVN